MAEYTEQQIFEALGLGAEVQEPAAPAAQPTEDNATTGAEAQEPAAPAEADSSSPATPSDEPGDGAGTGAEAPEPKPEKQPQTEAERRENAARRRQQEQQAAIRQAVDEALTQERSRQADEMASFFAQAGLKNTITGQPITNMEEFTAWRREFDQAELQRQLKAGKLTAEGLGTAIGNHPVVQQAQKLVEQSAAAQKAQEMETAKARIEAEIAEIGKLDASIGSLEDLVKAPYWNEVHAKTQRGYTLTDAFWAVNRERLETARAEAARQQAMANARGKEHMAPAVTPTGTGAVSVPAEEMTLFRQLMPEASTAEIQAYYNKYKNK